MSERSRFVLSRFRRCKISPLRFFAIALASLFVTIALPDFKILPIRFGVSPAYSQTVVTNQASAEYTPPVGPPVPVTSNSTSVGGTTAGTTGITKTADRGAAEPGDVVTYRLVVTNATSSATTGPVTVTDTLPLGVQLIPSSITTSPAATTTIVSGQSFTLTFPALAAGSSINIAYSAEITGDAVRGSGRNVAQATLPGIGTFTATFQLIIRPGILSDCGTIIGRVFVDKNFDGEQQLGEPGVPNAVLFMDDGNRIITDPDGLFSLINVISGNRVGTLDLSSLPGYTLAPNLYWLADNSVSRLVRLEPGGLARMNFAVTPTFGEGQS